MVRAKDLNAVVLTIVSWCPCAHLVKEKHIRKPRGLTQGEDRK